MESAWQTHIALPGRSRPIAIINPTSGESVDLPGQQQHGRTPPTSPIHKTNGSSSTAIQHDANPSLSQALAPSLSAKEPPARQTKEKNKNLGDTGNAFNIYASPFVPETLTVINTLRGHLIDTPSTKHINFKEYSHPYLPQRFLPPIPLPIEIPINASFRLDDAAIYTHYEPYFQFHLEKEIQSHQKENASYSLYGHTISILSHSAGNTTCSIVVPGLRENRPYIEEDDVVQLRELHFDRDGNPLGMRQWLTWYTQFGLGGKGWSEAAAPGWTGFIYNARVLSVRRKEEQLVVGFFGITAQNSSIDLRKLGEQQFRFNVQFPISRDRYFPMQVALSITQEAFRHAKRAILLHHTVSAATYQARTMSSTNFSPSADSPLSRTPSFWIQSMLFPEIADCETQQNLNAGFFGRPFFDEQLNWEQKKATESVFLRNYGTLPFLISGPPGTGKTKTLVEIALQLINSVDQEPHVLFCAPSDPAADTIVQRISANFKPADLLRLNRPSRTFAEVPGAVLPYCYVFDNKFDLPPFKQLLSYKLIVTTCRDASLLLYSRLTNSDLYAVETGIISAIHPETQPPQVALHWTALLMDESAQAIEPEVLIPLSVIAPPHEFSGSKPPFVLAGDEHQLGPRTSLRSSPLKNSLFARLFSRPVYAEHPLARGKTGKAPPPLTKTMLPIARPAFANLIRNYRSHPAILAVPSALFYADTLEPEAEEIDRLASWGLWKGRRWPVLYHSNASKDELETDGGGWYNFGEARIACRYAALLIESGLVEQREVCIMAPFKAQVQCLRRTIREPQFGSLWDVDIGPTEAFQGLERGVVILCTTRSKKRFLNKDKEAGWGIFNMPNIMNVALTRAKFGLIVIGRRQILREDANWKVFLEFCDRNGLVSGLDDKRGRKDQDESRETEITRLEKVMLEMEREENGEGERVRGGMFGYTGMDEMWENGLGIGMQQLELEEGEDSDAEEECSEQEEGVSLSE